MKALLLLTALGAGHASFQELPAHGGGKLTLPWQNGEPQVWRDRTPGSAGELFGFGFSDKLYLYKSNDLGVSWSFVDPAANESIGNKYLLGVTQDSAGKVHLLFIDGGGGDVRYFRIALAHTGGVITGFRSEVKNVALPGSYNTNNDVRGYALPVIDSSGAEVLVFGVNDRPLTNGVGFRLQLGKTTTLAPMTTGDFTKLDGTAGATVAFTSTVLNNHDHNGLFTQLPATKDLWVFMCNIDAEYGAPSASFMTRLRLTAAANRTWTVGTPVESVGSDATSSPELLALTATQNHVWMLYLDPTKGLSIARVAGDGTYTAQALPSPDPTPHRNGWGVLSVAEDETRAWTVWNTMTGPTGSMRTQQAYLENGTWTKFSDQAPFLGDSWGFGASWNWKEGVVAVRLNGSNYALQLSSVFSGSSSGSGGGVAGTGGGMSGAGGGVSGTGGGVSGAGGGDAGGASADGGGTSGTGGGSEEPMAGARPCGCHTGGPAMGMFLVAFLKRRMRRPLSPVGERDRVRA